MAELADTLVLSLAGELCLVEVPALRSQLDDLIAAGARQVVLDLTETTLVTAAALRVFDTAEHRLTGLGGTLRLRNPPPLPGKVLELTGLAGLIETE